MPVIKQVNFEQNSKRTPKSLIAKTNSPTERILSAEPTYRNQSFLIEEYETIRALILFARKYSSQAITMHLFRDSEDLFRKTDAVNQKIINNKKVLIQKLQETPYDRKKRNYRAEKALRDQRKLEQAQFEQAINSSQNQFQAIPLTEEILDLGEIPTDLVQNNSEDKHE